ncbi:DUF1775 domain-containing protein [Microbacterium sp.]|uniref:DUF1775 domain-containing protein n=1 Tax=Microbacterium sp. TaxID=51671 RepID=UPI003A8F664F
MTRITSRTRLVVGASAGLLLALAVPLAASAHVEVGPDSAAAGSTTPLTFSFHHGCDDSPTTSLKITIPDGIGNATPVYEGGWTIKRALRADGTPSAVTFTADTPIESGVEASVSLDTLIDTSAAGKTLPFLVEQTCVKGSTSWTQIPAQGQSAEDLDNPAPAVTVGPKAPTTAGADASAHGSSHADASAPATTAEADPVARWLGAGGLVAGVAALVVAIVGVTRRRRAS